MIGFNVGNIAALIPIPSIYQTFPRWAALVTEALSLYACPQFSGTEEDGWKDWAIQLYRIDELAAAGVPNPSAYDDWRAWGVRLYETCT